MNRLDIIALIGNNRLFGQGQYLPIVSRTGGLVAGKNLALPSLATFAILLLIAIALQSLVVLFLGLRGALQSDLDHVRQQLRTAAVLLAEKSASAAELQHFLAASSLAGDSFSCLVLEAADQVTKIGQCRYAEQLQALGRQVAEGQVFAANGEDILLEYAGMRWQLFMLRSESVLLAATVSRGDGRIVGSLAAEHSLTPVYGRLQSDGRIALAYLLATVIICASLFYLRLNNLIFRPMEQLAQLAENYRPDGETFFHPAGEGGLFRRLSAGMHGMVQRIQEDNRRLRASVGRLEIANRELEEKKDLLVRSEKLASVGRLSAGLAHEIGNPLAIIQGYVDLLGRDDCSAHERADYSAKAQQELDRIQALSRRLLDFARPRPTTTMVAANDLVTEVLAFMAVEKSFAGCRLIKELDARRDLLLADQDALRQVLINCLYNAADAMVGCPESDREIVVGTANAQGDNRRDILLLTVADRGPGVAAEHLEEIFEPFYSTKESGKGTGLGLFVCQTIVDGLKGAISAENRAEGGLVIRIELPLPVEEGNTSG